MKDIGVYIMGNEIPTLYTGISRHIIRRVLEHKKGKLKGFTQKYNLKMCLYFEFCETMENAIIREKQIKNMSRKEKINLIKLKNSSLVDISNELFSLIDNIDDVITFDEV